MQPGAWIGLIFVFLSLVFFGLSYRDYRKSKGARTPARRAWLRVGFIFAIVGVLLYLINTLKSH
jgi:O-antigen/teichoic acid export membrane protein